MLNRKVLTACTKKTTTNIIKYDKNRKSKYEAKQIHEFNKFRNKTIMLKLTHYIIDDNSLKK